MKIKNIITLSIVSLLVLVLTSCNAFSGVKLKDYKNEVDQSKYIREYTEMIKDDDFYSGDYDLAYEGKASTVKETEEYISSKSTYNFKLSTNLNFKLSFDKDSKVYNYNVQSNVNRKTKSEFTNYSDNYKGIHDYTYQIEGKNLYSLNNKTKEGLRKPNSLELISKAELAGKLLKDVNSIMNHFVIVNPDIKGETQYYVDGNVFTMVSTFSANERTYEVVSQEIINADNRELLQKSTVTYKNYDEDQKLKLTYKEEYNFQVKLTLKDLNLNAKNVDKYNIVLDK